MSHQVSFHPKVQAEVHTADQWYEQQKPGLGRAFTAAVERTLTEIMNNPARYGYIDARRRAAQVSGFSYIIYYYELSDGSVRITAIQHSSRDPAAWQSRR